MTRRYLKFPALSNKLGGRSRASIQRDMRDRGFPMPINLGANSTVWDEEAVDEWMRQLTEAQYIPKPVAIPKQGEPKPRGRKRKSTNEEVSNG